MATYSNQRKAYGETLVELGKADRRVVVLDADLCKSTMSVLFQDAFPERFFEMGIAEANMMSTAAGLAVSGKIAFASTFRGVRDRPGVRPDSPDDFHRQVERENLRLVLRAVGLRRRLDAPGDRGRGDHERDPEHDGADADGRDGSAPGGARGGGHQGPVYIRVNRNPGAGRAAQGRDASSWDSTACCGKGRDVLLLAHGVMVEKALAAAVLLEKEGVSAKVASVGDHEAVQLRRRRGTGARHEGSRDGGGAQLHRRTGGGSWLSPCAGVPCRWITWR